MKDVKMNEKRQNFIKNEKFHERRQNNGIREHE